MLHINRYNPQFKTHIKLASKTPVETAETKLRAWPIGAAVNQHKKDMTVKSMSPENPPDNTTGRSTGVQSSIPPTSKSVKFTKFPMVNFTSSGVSGMGKTAAENTGDTGTPLSPNIPPSSPSPQTRNNNTKTLINAGIGTGVMANIGNLKSVITSGTDKGLQKYVNKLYANRPKEFPKEYPTGTTGGTFKFYERGLGKLLKPYGYKQIIGDDGFKYNGFISPDNKNNVIMSTVPQSAIHVTVTKPGTWNINNNKYTMQNFIGMPHGGPGKNLSALAHEVGHHLFTGKHGKLSDTLRDTLPKAARGLLGAQLLNDSVGRLIYGDKTADKMSAPLAIGGTIAASGKFMDEAIASGYGAGALMRSSKWWRPRGVKRILNTFSGVPTYLSAGMLVPGAVYAGSKFLRNRVNKTLEQNNTNTGGTPKTASDSITNVNPHAKNYVNRNMWKLHGRKFTPEQIATYLKHEDYNDLVLNPYIEQNFPEISNPAAVPAHLQYNPNDTSKVPKWKQFIGKKLMKMDDANFYAAHGFSKDSWKPEQSYVYSLGKKLITPPDPAKKEREEFMAADKKNRDAEYFNRESQLINYLSHNKKFQKDFHRAFNETGEYLDQNSKLRNLANYKAENAFKEKMASTSPKTHTVTLDQIKDVINIDGSLNREGFLRLKQENPEGAERVLKSHIKRVAKTAMAGKRKPGNPSKTPNSHDASTTPVTQTTKEDLDKYIKILTDAIKLNSENNYNPTKEQKKTITKNVKYLNNHPETVNYIKPGGEHWTQVMETPISTPNPPMPPKNKK